MWRASLLVALGLVGALETRALADEEPHAQPPPGASAPVSSDPRDAVAQQLAAESAAIERTLAIVSEKLTTADAERTRRLAAAYRMLQAAPGEDRMLAARRRAAARFLVERDLAERRLLSDEAGQLRAAATQAGTEAARLPEIVLPSELARPAKGALARRFGTFVHDRSKATLSRRGLDIEVLEGRAPVVACADGTVRYVGPIRGLDHGVIIDHGSFLTVIAKLGELAVPVGARVTRGDRIGRAARHRVYVEVRVKIGAGGLPIDPEPLFSASR